MTQEPDQYDKAALEALKKIVESDVDAYLRIDAAKAILNRSFEARQ